MPNIRDVEQPVNPRWLAFWRKVKEAATELDAKQEKTSGVDAPNV